MSARKSKIDRKNLAERAEYLASLASLSGGHAKAVRSVLTDTIALLKELERKPVDE